MRITGKGPKGLSKKPKPNKVPMFVEKDGNKTLVGEATVLKVDDTPEGTLVTYELDDDSVVAEKLAMHLPLGSVSFVSRKKFTK